MTESGERSDDVGRRREAPLPEDPLTIRRKLTSILYADVAGYSRLTGDDELGTHQRVMSSLDRASETIDKAGGNVLRYAGDAILAEFGSVVACVNAAVAIQQRYATLWFSF